MSQIDFVLGRLNQSNGPAKERKPIRTFQVAQWRDGNRQYPTQGQICHERRYTPSKRQGYDVRAMDYDFRTGSGRTDILTQNIDAKTAQLNPTTWPAFNEALHKAAKEVYPPTIMQSAKADECWKRERAIQNTPSTII